MNGSKAIHGWFWFLGVTAALGVVVLVQQRSLGALRAARDQLAAAALTTASVAADVARAAPDPAAVTFSQPAAVSRDDEDHAAIRDLQTEINQLRERITARERALREFVAARSTARRHRIPITEATLPYTEWTNAGQGTPEAAIETALWAGASGDLRAFDQLLTFEDDAAAAARTLFARLPPDVRAEYERPERIIALLAAADVPLTAAQIRGKEIRPDHHVVITQIHSAEIKPGQPSRLIRFRTRVDPGGDTWRIVVPRGAVDAYVARLTGEPVIAAAE